MNSRVIPRQGPEEEFDYDNAEQLYNSVLKQAQILLEENRDENCVAYLKSFISSGQLGPFSTPLYINFAVIFDKKKNYKLVIELLKGIKQEYMQIEMYSALLALLSFAYMKEKMYHQAIETFYTALENNSPGKNIWNIHYDLGLCYREINNYPESKKHYRLALANHPPKDKIADIETELFSLKIRGGVSKILGFFIKSQD